MTGPSAGNRLALLAWIGVFVAAVILALETAAQIHRIGLVGARPSHSRRSPLDGWPRWLFVSREIDEERQEVTPDRSRWLLQVSLSRGSGDRTLMSERDNLLIGDIPGFTPQMGRLVSMMNYVRSTTLTAVEGLKVEQLDYLSDAQSNSIGALLSHIAAAEVGYQAATFDGGCGTWDRPLAMLPTTQRRAWA